MSNWFNLNFDIECDGFYHGLSEKADNFISMGALTVWGAAPDLIHYLILIILISISIRKQKDKGAEFI